MLHCQRLTVRSRSGHEHEAGNSVPRAWRHWLGASAMKIAIWHNLPSGGGKRALYYHVKGLLQRGHTVECWCPPSADQAYLPLSDLTVEHIRPLAWPQPSRRPLSSTLAEARATVRRLEALGRHAQLCAEGNTAPGIRCRAREFLPVLSRSCHRPSSGIRTHCSVSPRAIPRALRSTSSTPVGRASRWRTMAPLPA
jgi:hypothetical protein